jgi:hypothetical protein
MFQNVLTHRVGFARAASVQSKKVAVQYMSTHRVRFARVVSFQSEILSTPSVENAMIERFSCELDTSFRSFWALG